MRPLPALVALFVAVSAASAASAAEETELSDPALQQVLPSVSTSSDLTDLTESLLTAESSALQTSSASPLPAPVEDDVGDDLTDRYKYHSWNNSSSDSGDATDTQGAASIVPIGVMQLPPMRPPPFPPVLSLPPKHSHEHQGRYGPFFEDGTGAHNVTARVGSTVLLDCKIGMLQDKTVTWLHHRGESMHLLTVGTATYSSDQRIALRLRYPNNWRLEISHVSPRDQGIYECQVATHPPRVRTIFLRVTAPKVMILDEEGHTVTERYYKAGSAVELSCVARQIETPSDTLMWWRGSKILTVGISRNASAGPGAVSSTLTLKHAQKVDSGNYTCTVGTAASSSVSVHVLNGDNPEAVHDGNSGVISGRVTMWLLAFVQCTQMLTTAR